MSSSIDRRRFLTQTAASALGAGLAVGCDSEQPSEQAEAPKSVKPLLNAPAEKPIPYPANRPKNSARASS